MNNEILDREYNDFLYNMTDYGSADLYEAIKTANQVGISGKELADLVRNFCDDTQTELAKADVCYIIYEHILNSARNEIEQKTKFDISNDANFSTYANYMCTSFECDDDDVELLKTALEKLEKDDLDDLLSDDNVKFFMDEIGLELPGVKA